LENDDNTVTDDFDKQVEKMEGSTNICENNDNKTDFLLIPTIKPSHRSSFLAPETGLSFV